MIIFFLACGRKSPARFNLLFLGGNERVKSGDVGVKPWPEFMPGLENHIDDGKVSRYRERRCFFSLVMLAYVTLTNLNCKLVRLA